VIHEGQYYIGLHLAYHSSDSEQDSCVSGDTELDVPYPFSLQLRFEEITGPVRQDCHIRSTPAQRAGQANQLPFSSSAEQVCDQAQ
jgi:hypothetical protein